MSTGVIGAMLPMEKIHAGIQAAAAQLGDDAAVARKRRPRHHDHRHGAQDSRPGSARSAASPTRVTGIAKGAAMIGPNMGTMLSLVMTDAALR